MSPPRAPLRGLAADLAAWFCIPAAFLAVCVGRHLLPAEAVAPHLRLLLLPLLGLTLLRLVLAATGVGAKTVRAVAALAASLLLATMLAYYVTVVIGLQSWGRVVSWDLISSYAPQIPMLAGALEVSLPLAAAAALLAWLALLAAAWLYFGRFDWTAGFARPASRGFVAAVVCAGGAFGAIELYSFLAAPPTQSSEPVSLTFWPTEGAWNYDGHAVETLKLAILDAAEDRERAAYRPAPKAERRNVILIVVDALRPDHMGIYGYARDTTPTLARLERTGTLRKAAAVRASCASSFCGLLSLASSKFMDRISARPITLQEVLRLHGYRIHMILSGDHTLFYGLRQAYGQVDEYFDASSAGTIRYMNDDRIMLERLAAYPSWDGKPVMMQFHVMAAHPLHNREGRAGRYAPAANYVLHREPGAQRPSQRSVNYYDNGVLDADDSIRSILEILERKGYLRDALVAITADHGEAIGEHGFYQHANSVREEVLRIPFLLVAYGHRPARPLQAVALASQADIAPTLLAELGMPRPATWQGSALQEPARREFLPFQERWEAGVYDLRDPRKLWKYWLNLKSGEEYAFDLTEDPGEQVNLIGKLAEEQKRELQRQVVGRGVVTAKRRLEDPQER